MVTNTLMRLAAMVVLVLGPAVGCSDEKPENPKAVSVAQGKAESKEAPEAEPEAPPARPPRPPSCADVFKTGAVTEASAAVKMTLAGGHISFGLEPSSLYPKSAIWAAGDAPASCGALKPVGKDDARLVWVVQLHRDGVPALRLQFLGTNAGESAVAEAHMTALYRPGRDDTASTLAFEKGTVKVTPVPLVAGSVQVELVGVKGQLLGSPPRPITLNGKLTGTFGAPGS